MRPFWFLSLLLVSSCASSLERMQEVRENAPDWYEARKQELFGRSYPNISDVPELENVRERVERLDLTAEEAQAILTMFAEDERTALVDETPEEMKAWADTIRRAAEGRLPPPDFLTDEEVAALKAVFDRPRARL